jgi:hypothetical protein
LVSIMDSEQHLEYKEESTPLYDTKAMEPVPCEKDPDNPCHRQRRDDRVRETDVYASHRNTPIQRFLSSQKKIKVSDFGPSQADDKSYLKNSTTNMFLLLCFLITTTNIAILSYHHRADDHSNSLRGGDYVKECEDAPGDPTCYEVRDAKHHLIYRMHNGQRFLAFSQCSTDAPETHSLKCIGELSMSQLSTRFWNYRLYHDQGANEYSIVAGPHQVDLTDDFYRVRHMLNSPYNWIISKEAIPQNLHPEFGLYIKDSVLFERTSR